MILDFSHFHELDRGRRLYEGLITYVSEKYIWTRIIDIFRFH